MREALILILQIGIRIKTQHKQLKSCPRSYCSKRQSQDLSPDRLTVDPVLFTSRTQYTIPQMFVFTFGTHTLPQYHTASRPLALTTSILGCSPEFGCRCEEEPVLTLVIHSVTKSATYRSWRGGWALKSFQ